MSLCVITGTPSMTLLKSPLQLIRKHDAWRWWWSWRRGHRGREAGGGPLLLAQGLWVEPQAWPLQKVCGVLTGWASQTPPHRGSRRLAEGREAGGTVCASVSPTSQDPALGCNSQGKLLQRHILPHKTCFGKALTPYCPLITTLELTHSGVGR